MSGCDRSPETVTVVFAANDYYTPYLSTLIASLLHHFSPGRGLELIVLARDFTRAHKEQLQRQAQRGGATLTFVDVAEAMRPFEEHLHTWAHFKIETYFRLLLPELLPDHHKVVYLDSDMVCCADVAELFDTDVEGYLVAACRDADTTGIYNGVDIDLGQPDKRAYMDDVLKIENPYDYFQAGTIVFNLDEWRRTLDIGEVFAFAQQRTWQLLDQDVLNYFCQGHVTFLDLSWNVMFDNGGFRISDIISRSTPELYAAYMEARKHPRIIHYAGPFKPWSHPDCDFGDVFWHYAHMTPYGELMVMREAQEREERIEREHRQRLDELDERLRAIEADFARYTGRSATLMFKEFCYQKVLRPCAHALFRTQKARSAASRLYRTVHPAKNQDQDEV